MREGGLNYLDAYQACHGPCTIPAQSRDRKIPEPQRLGTQPECDRGRSYKMLLDFVGEIIRI